MKHLLARYCSRLWSSLHVFVQRIADGLACLSAKNAEEIGNGSRGFYSGNYL